MATPPRPRRFLTPKRRLTRQRSGFNVSGGGLGSTCRIDTSQLICPESGEIKTKIFLPDLEAPQVFQRDIAIVGAGVYILPEGSCRYSGSLSWEEEGRVKEIKIEEKSLVAGKWNRVGEISEIPTNHRNKINLKNVSLNLVFFTRKPLNAFSPLIGSLSLVHFIEKDIYTAFRQKTSLYIPEILYLDPFQEQRQLHILQGALLGEGRPIVCKSCNRCNRYQPIDVCDERNTLSYSNHCVSRAPCTHAAFAQYRIVNGEGKLLGAKQVKDNNVVTRYGHQLECIVCKKFFVNLPLNPLRNSTQHREDSLRRRAFEVLVNELLGREWIYHEHRMATGSEFDLHIWSKFDKRCFKCNKEISSPNAMDLDHTLPLAYLWPLDNTATCLCSSCNSSKSDKFPIDFYGKDQVKELSRRTGIALKTLESRPINIDAVNRLFDRIEWFFDVFLAEKDYQKIRHGKKAADLIVHAIQNVLTASGITRDLVKTYQRVTGKYPATINITA